VVTRERAGRGVPAGRAHFSAGAAGLRVTDSALPGKVRLTPEPPAEPALKFHELRPVKRGWCPDVLHPMPTGDGLLVRLYPPLGRLTAGQLKAIATAARSCGNGLLDISRRGNLQIRGVLSRLHPALVGQLAAAGLAGRATRRTIVSPLAGIDPIDHVDAAALAEQVEAALRTVRGLPGKFAIAVDGGGLFPLVELDAEIYAVAVSSSSIAVGLAAADGPRWCGTTPPSALPSAVVAMLTDFAEAVGSGTSSAMRDAPADLRAKLADTARLAPPAVPTQRPMAPRSGPLQMPGGRATVVLALPFGRCDADQLTQIASWAERLGGGEVRLSPWRGIVIPEVRRQDLSILIALASGAGLIIEPADPRLAVFACPGQPDCANASVMTRRDAARLAAAASALLQTGGQIHVSGCAKGCAHPGPAALTLVGENGAYRVVVGGTPHDPGVGCLAIDDIERRLSSVQTRADLASRFSAEVT
jgi:precorrin-3B synthase